MKTRTGLALLLLAALAVPVAAGEAPAAAAGAPKLPYVYTNWKQFTVADGLPNDHIFAVKVDGPRVWVGTEDGLALIDKPTGKVVKTWQEKDGLPFKVVLLPGLHDAPWACDEGKAVLGSVPTHTLGPSTFTAKMWWFGSPSATVNCFQFV